MKKKLVIALLLGISYMGNAQELNNWQVGLNLNPFIFSRINSDYPFEKSKQDFPNGFELGLTIEKNWNEHWGFKTGIEYSKQNQKYVGKHIPDIGANIVSDFNYYKIPFSVQYSIPIKENLYLTFNQGFQFSLLNDYKTVFDDDLQTITIHNSSYIFDSKTDNGYGVSNTDWYYKKNTLGLIGSIGLKGFLAKRLSYATNLKYEYDLTKADAFGFYIGTNDNTKNFRIGLELGLQYHFSLKGCGYCDLQKH
jgi:hypothetical protein